MSLTTSTSEAIGFNSETVTVMAKQLEGSNVFLGLSAISTSRENVVPAIEQPVLTNNIPDHVAPMQKKDLQDVKAKLAALKVSLDEMKKPYAVQYVLLNQHPETVTQPLAKAIPEWAALSNEKLEVVLNRWAVASGWKIEMDPLVPSITVGKDVQLKGPMTAAVQALFKVIPSTYPVKVFVYTEDKLVVISKIEMTASSSGWTVEDRNEWSFKRDQKLNNLLIGWCAKSGWSFIWDMGINDREVGSDGLFRQNFEIAITSLAKLINESMDINMSVNLLSKEIRISKRKSGSAQLKNQIVTKG